MNYSSSSFLPSHDNDDDDDDDDDDAGKHRGKTSKPPLTKDSYAPLPIHPTLFTLLDAPTLLTSNVFSHAARGLA